jgi:anti-sigma factor RsiW
MNLPCPYTENDAQEYADRTMDEPRAQAFGVHLDSCPICRSALEAYCALDAALGDLGPGVLPSDLHEGILKGIPFRAAPQPAPKWLQTAPLLLASALLFGIGLEAGAGLLEGAGLLTNILPDTFTLEALAGQGADLGAGFVSALKTLPFPTGASTGVFLLLAIALVGAAGVNFAAFRMFRTAHGAVGFVTGP